MAISKLNGNDYIIFVDDTTPITSSAGAAYEPLMCMSSNGFSGTTDAIDIADKCNDGFADSTPGNSSWEITGTGNAIDETLESSAASYQKLFELWQAKKVFWMKLANKAGNTNTAIIREGIGYFSSYSETADTDTPYTFDFTFTGKGELNGIPSTT